MQKGVIMQKRGKGLKLCFFSFSGGIKGEAPASTGNLKTHVIISKFTG
ncbi:hypothetical protein [Methanosarcina sp. KYL-1]|nr:hypothetical protein [Methanosarcina sp. KYL-1]